MGVFCPDIKPFSFRLKQNEKTGMCQSRHESNGFDVFLFRNKREDGECLKIRLCRLLCLICVFTIAASCIIFPAQAEGIIGKAASVYGYALNDKMYQFGVISTDNPGDFLSGYAGTDNYPSGVVYSDVIYFDNDQTPYLVIFRADGAGKSVCADIIAYDDKLQRAETIAVIPKGYNTDYGVVGQFAIGENDGTHYIIYREYMNNLETKSEYYTVIDGTAFGYLNEPACAVYSPVLSWNSSAFKPEVDVSEGNSALNEFFSELKDASAQSVTYPDISEYITDNEEERIESILTKAAGYYNFDIGNYTSVNDYNLALTRRETDDKFYLITNLYDLGNELYYVRYSTNKSFYNYAVIRRTDSEYAPYQLLVSRTDSIPLSDTELVRLKEVLERNKLVSSKAKGSIELLDEKTVQAQKRNTTEKLLNMPKIFDPAIRKPVGVVAGGLCLAVLVILWIYIGKENEQGS